MLVTWKVYKLTTLFLLAWDVISIFYIKIIRNLTFCEGAGVVGGLVIFSDWGRGDSGDEVGFARDLLAGHNRLKECGILGRVVSLVD